MKNFTYFLFIICLFSFSIASNYHFYPDQDYWDYLNEEDKQDLIEKENELMDLLGDSYGDYYWECFEELDPIGNYVTIDQAECNVEAYECQVVCSDDCAQQMENLYGDIDNLPDGAYQDCTEPCFYDCGQCNRDRNDQIKQYGLDFATCIAGKSGYTFSSDKCSLKITKDYDGVSADGSSSISFSLEVTGDHDSFDFYLVPIDGALDGVTSKPNSKTIIYTPNSANSPHTYLTPQPVNAVAECTPKNLQTKVTISEKFTVEQPPLFFVHGWLSNASPLWDNFEQRAESEGWEYLDISYPGDGDNIINAQQLAQEITDFIQQINDGYFYNNKKISATKLDVVAHSMGGLVTRAYISYFYQGDIRKFVMIATPNHGAQDARYASFLGIGGVATEQLKPNNPFLNDLNSQNPLLHPDIEYHLIAGVGWLTDTSNLQLVTCRGDAIVTLESAKLEGVPTYCVYDTHNSQTYWFFPMCPLTYFHNGGGWFTSEGGTVSTSDASYSTTKSLLLTGTAVSVAPCDLEDSPAPAVRAVVKSPVTIHAYDIEGNHIGFNEENELVNEIGEGAYYSNGSETEHQIIKIAGAQDITFEIIGESEGEFGFELTKWNEEGEETTFDLGITPTGPEVVHTVDGSSETPELIKEINDEPLCPSLFVLLFAFVVMLASRTL